VSRGAQVTGLDLREHLEPIEGVTLELGPHRQETLDQAHLIVVSPGIPAASSMLGLAGAAGAEIIGELGFAASMLDAPIVAITGTNGKSTVTWFTRYLLEAAGFNVFAGGNLGRPLCEAVLAGGVFDVLVVEVSSYQLELAGGLAPRVAAILNLTPDHLARHGSMRGYAEAKARLLTHMTDGDVAFLPSDCPLVDEATGGVGTARRAWLGRLPGVTRVGRSVQVAVGEVACVLDLSGVALPGEHNLDNAATAAALAIAMGASPAAVQQALPGLTALEHRMELVVERDGVQWINDSKATNVDAAQVGIVGLGRPAVVLLGGQAKGSGFAALADGLARHRAVLAFGGSGRDIARELRAAGVEVETFESMDDAVERARVTALPGDAVLLSPGCASFDAYDNFEHRGRCFKHLALRETA
jgi:UDP-N-acetylmuramoylalanine--D-glutamate ligase